MKLAARIGVSISDFWEMTPAELNIYAIAYGERKKADDKILGQNNMVLAFLISRWVWQKRVDIESCLNKLDGEDKKEMTDEEMFKNVMKLNAALGGTVVTKEE